MAYVDLNPARAAMCETLDDSDHTSIQRRLSERGSLSAKIKSSRSLLDRPLKPVAGLDAEGLLDISESSYIELVQWTGEQARSDNRGKLKALARGKRAAPADIWQVSNHPDAWLRQVQGTESIYYRAIGSALTSTLKPEVKMPACSGVCRAWKLGSTGSRPMAGPKKRNFAGIRSQAGT